MVEIEIGKGKTARRAYWLDDVTIVPSSRTRDADDVDTSWKIVAYRFDLPVLTSGGLEPLTADAAADAGRSGTLAVLDLAPFAEDAGPLKELVAGLHEDGHRVAARCSPRKARERVPDALAAEVDVLVIQGDIVSAEHVSRTSEPLNLKTFIRELDLPVIVGGCASHAAALHLLRTGAAGVLVGIDRADLGVGVPLATALADARSARVRHLDESGVYCHVIGVGGVRSGADVAKAIACGADAVMVGTESVENSAAEGLAELLRRAMATCGYTDLKSFQKADLMVAP